MGKSPPNAVKLQKAAAPRQHLTISLRKALPGTVPGSNRDTTVIPEGSVCGRPGSPG